MPIIEANGSDESTDIWGFEDLSDNVSWDEFDDEEERKTKRKIKKSENERNNERTVKNEVNEEEEEEEELGIEGLVEYINWKIKIENSINSIQ